MIKKSLFEKAGIFYLGKLNYSTIFDLIINLNMTKKSLLISFVLCCINFVNAQNSYITQTTDSLQKLLKVAVSKSEYSLAADVKSELTSRQNEEIKIKELEATLVQKVKEEDFANAAIIDAQLKKLKADFSKKTELRESIKLALIKQNYSDAALLKKELQLYYSTNLNNKPYSPETTSEAPQKQAPQKKTINQNPLENYLLLSKPAQKNNTNLHPANKPITSLVVVPFEAFYYNYVYSDLFLGFKYFKDNIVYTGAYGSNAFADFILRSNMGVRFNNGIYIEGGVLGYTINEKFDKSGDFCYAFDWEFGYAEKINGIGLLLGLHVVQLNSAQFSIGIGF